MRILFRLMLGVALLATTSVSYAQWHTQQIDLQPGWNAIYVEVNPVPNDIDTILSGLPIETVWSWDERFSTVQFIDDPDDLLPSNPDWGVWFPQSSPQASLKSLYTLMGNTSYLVKVAGTKSHSIQLTGMPVAAPRIDWIPDSYNLIGFSLDDRAPELPDFKSFFSGSSAHAESEVLRLNSSGLWEPVNPATARMKEGEAFWIYTTGRTEWVGPIKVTIPYGGILDYDRVLTMDSFTLMNSSDKTRTITIHSEPSQEPPAAAGLDSPVVAGPVPLSYQVFDPEKGIEWFDLGADPGSGIEYTLPPGGVQEVRLSVMRQKMNEFSSSDSRPFRYQSLIRISDGEGSLVLVPVRARGLAADQPEGESGTAGLLGVERLGTGGMENINPRAGLWVGQVTIDAVSQAAIADDPVRVASPMEFRLMVHVDKAGTARLLEHVVIMLDPEERDSEGNVTKPPELVLLTDDALVAQFEGIAQVDNSTVGRRISTIAFGMLTPENPSEPRNTLRMTGSFDSRDNVATPVGILTATVLTPWNSPLNPFYHRYHPDHDNLDFLFEPLIDDPLTSEDEREGVESYDITREITLEFSAENPEPGIGNPNDWRDNRVGGNYAETISGIYRRPIHVTGIFNLRRVSPIDHLN